MLVIHHKNARECSRKERIPGLDLYSDEYVDSVVVIVVFDTEMIALVKQYEGSIVSRWTDTMIDNKEGR